VEKIKGVVQKSEGIARQNCKCNVVFSLWAWKWCLRPVDFLWKLC